MSGAEKSKHVLSLTLDADDHDLKVSGEGCQPELFAADCLASGFVGFPAPWPPFNRAKSETNFARS